MSKTLTTYNIKPKPIHLRTLKKLVENGGNVSKAMRDAGYSKETARNPSKLTNTKGFRKLMKQSGLTDEFLGRALYEDIKCKPMNRVQELTLAFKLLGKLNRKVDSGQIQTIVASYESFHRYKNDIYA